MTPDSQCSRILAHLQGGNSITPLPYIGSRMEKLTTLDLFSGIGGFALGLERTGGFETAAFCEIEDFQRRVLKKHWPEVPCYRDVRKLTAGILDGDGIGRIDVVTGGFPCQDISISGRQAGITEGTRSGLWSEIVRLIGELRPRYVIVENVSNLLRGPSERRGGWFGRVLGDLAELGYDAEWDVLPAHNFGLPHRRDRVFLIAYPSKAGWQGISLYDFARRRDSSQEIRKSSYAGPLVGTCGWEDWEEQSGICLVGDGFPNGVDRCGVAGNAIVPAIAEMIGRAILAAEAKSWFQTQNTG